MTRAEALELAEKLYVTGDIFRNQKLLDALPSLPKSCVESSRIILGKRDLYERDGVFPPGVIDYIAAALADEDDENLNRYLSGLADDTRRLEARRVMHKDVHRH